SERAQYAALVAQIAEHRCGGQRRQFGETGCDHDAVGDSAQRVLEDIDDFEVKVALQVLLAYGFEIRDGPDRVGSALCNVEGHHHGPGGHGFGHGLGHGATFLLTNHRACLV